MKTLYESILDTDAADKATDTVERRQEDIAFREEMSLTFLKYLVELGIFRAPTWTAEPSITFGPDSPVKSYVAWATLTNRITMSQFVYDYYPLIVKYMRNAVNKSRKRYPLLSGDYKYYFCDYNHYNKRGNYISMRISGRRLDSEILFKWDENLDGFFEIRLCIDPKHIPNNLSYKFSGLL